MRLSQIRKQSLVSVLVASLCMIAVPTALSGTGEAESPTRNSRIAPCWWLVDPIPTDTTVDETIDETTETTTHETADTTTDETADTTTDETADETADTTTDETTDTTIARPLPSSCWYGPIHPHCWNWPRIHIDPPVTTPPTTELPPVDEPSEPTYTIEPDGPPFREEPSEPTYTIEPQEPPFIEEQLPSVLYCFKHLPSTGPLGTSEDGSISITGISPDVLPADDSYEGGLITIYGSGFRSGSTVMIGEEECTAVEVIDEYTITCDPPSGDVSIRDLVVIDSEGISVTAPAAFEFADPAGFWDLPLYAFISNPLDRSVVDDPTEDSASDEDLASADSGDFAIPVFTG